MAYKHKRKGAKRPILEGKSGDSWSTEHRRFMKVTQIVDREHDCYDKVVFDPFKSEIIRECHETLSAHQGKGSAKKEPR